MTLARQSTYANGRRDNYRMELPQLPKTLKQWAENTGITSCEWRTPGVADYQKDSDTWQVGEVILHCVAEADENRYYCGLYEGPMERHPVMYYVTMPLAMLPSKESMCNSGF